MRRLLRSQPGEARSALFEQLRIELGAHEAAEERFLYVPMLMDDRGLHPSRDALADHHRMDEIARSSETRGKDLLPDFGKILRASEKAALAKHYRNDYLRMHATLADA
nr:hemerythrin domain-containing protein [Burkholderia multivorans]